MAVQALTGRALDAAVAERVMGWVRCLGPDLVAGPGSELIEWWGVAQQEGTQAVVACRDWQPYENIADAWRVVEKLVTHNRHFIDVRYNSTNDWTCVIDDDSEDRVAVSAPTAPEAICRAALAATEGR